MIRCDSLRAAGGSRRMTSVIAFARVLIVAPLLELLLAPAVTLSAEAPPDLIAHNGRIVTVDPAFSVRHAMSVRDGKIVAVGDDRDILATKGPATTVLDLGGKTVLPGLIDSHVHPGTAAMTEFDHP